VREEEEEDITLDPPFVDDDSEMMMDMSPATVGMWQHFVEPRAPNSLHKTV
jgi:hypothetical protein